MSAPTDNVLAASAYQTQTLARAQSTGCAVLVKVIVPVSSGTVSQAVDEVRGGVSGDRNTLGKLSAALDAQSAETLRQARNAALLYALVFG